MLVGKARSIPQGEAPKKCFTCVGSGLCKCVYYGFTSCVILALPDEGDEDDGVGDDDDDEREQVSML